MKKKSPIHFYISCATILVLVLFGCKSPETTIVRQAPTPASPDTAAEQTPETSTESAAFRQINIGENSPIATLDPLFADNASSMRAVQLVYEGLVRYDDSGDIIPGLASDWKVSEDSMAYTFTLRDNLYYHDSNAFSSGVGRRVFARDVISVFERMARMNVPDAAAQLFMDIKGFEPYYREQHHVYNPSLRVLNGIAGIQAPDNSTVVFQLANKDPHFLQKLASPFAVIYPREAISGNDPTQFKAVGAGPFTLSQQRGDSVYVFSKFDEYYNSEQPMVNRVDVLVKNREADLFRSFASGDLHILPELSVQTMAGVLDDSGELNPNYRNQFSLLKPGGKTEYRLHYNANADPGERRARLAAALFDSTDSFDGLPPELDLFQFRSFAGEWADSVALGSADTLNITNSRDPFARELMLKLRDKLQQQGGTLQVYDIYTPTRNTGLYTTSHLSFLPDQGLETDSSVLVEFSVPHMTLYRNEVTELTMNRWPWWMDLRSTTVTDSDNP
jgi:ABC-type transport system substrate-binding protein